MIPTVRQDVKIRREEFGALIFTNRTPILALNKDALAVWELIDGSRTTVDIIKVLLSNRAESSGVSSMVNEFIMSCAELGLVDINGPDSCNTDTPTTPPA